jgi:hypothetical protein
MINNSSRNNKNLFLHILANKMYVNKNYKIDLIIFSH